MQRFGCYAPEILEKTRKQSRIWVHGVSVGEVFVALKLIDQLRQQDPEQSFILSVTTSTGHAIACQRLSEQDVLVYFPVDLPWIMGRVLNRLNPCRLILVEGEFWPNLIRLCSKRGLPVSLVNGRMSDSSFRGYRRVRWLTRKVLAKMNPICMQGKQDRERMLVLGAPSQQTYALGSAKFDVADPQQVDPGPALKALRHAGIPAEARVLVGGSTWPGEEEILIEIYQDLRRDIPELALVLVPRHVERSHEVANLLEQAGLAYVRRSTLSGVQTEPKTLLVDTTGELMAFYAAASVVFVGKSLCETGGQNPLEPASLGKPVVVGPHMENFPGVMEQLLHDRAVLQVFNRQGLMSALSDLLCNPEQARDLGRRAQACVAAQRGVLDRSLHLMGLGEDPVD